MSEPANAVASSSTTPNPPSAPESTPAQTELIKLLSGLLRGSRGAGAVADPGITQQMAALVQSGKISQRHVLQVARILFSLMHP